MSNQKQEALSQLKLSVNDKLDKSYIPLSLVCVIGLSSDIWYVFLPLLIVATYFFVKNKNNKMRLSKEERSD